MRRHAIFYGLVVVVFLMGWVAGLIIQAATISAADPAVVQTVWSKQCNGDRVIVNWAKVVRCVKDVPPPQPTPSPAPTQDILSTSPVNTPQVCGDDPDYWTSCPPTPGVKP